MVSNTQVRCVALFFLFAFIDDNVALPAAGRTIAILKNKLSRLAEESTEAQQALVEVCCSQFAKYKKELERGKPSPTLGTILRTLSGTDLKSWIQFQKDAGEEELLSVIFNSILGISPSNVAAAMNISEGTAYYRLGRGIRRLGEIDRTLQPSQAN